MLYNRFCIFWLESWQGGRAIYILPSAILFSFVLSEKSILFPFYIHQWCSCANVSLLIMLKAKNFMFNISSTQFRMPLRKTNSRDENLFFFIVFRCRLRRERFSVVLYFLKYWKAWNTKNNLNDLLPFLWTSFYSHITFLVDGSQFLFLSISKKIDVDM